MDGLRRYRDSSKNPAIYCAFMLALALQTERRARLSLVKEVIEMPDRVIEKHVVHDNAGGGGGGAMTALAIVLFTIVLLAVLYFTGVFSRMFAPRDTKIDVDINKPGIVLQIR